MVLAQDESRALRHNYIGTEHLLLGLLREEEGLAARVLDAFDVTVHEVRALVVEIVGRGDEVATGQIPFTPRAKKVTELALREALSLGHNYVGTEHLLLGIVRENDGVAARILLAFSVNPDLVREATIEFLGSKAAAERWRQRKERQEAEAAAANPDLARRLAHARSEKERALDEGDFDRAARAHQEEAALRRALLGVPEPAPVRRGPSPHGADAREAASIRSVSTSSNAALLVAGAAICLIALAIGLLLGYLLWH